MYDNIGNTTLRVARLVRRLGPQRVDSRFDPPFLISAISLRPVDRAPSGIFTLAAGLSVHPSAPRGMVDGLANAPNWKVVDGAVQRAGAEWLAQAGPAQTIHLRLATGVRNSGDGVKYVWLPLLYRTSTPSSLGDGHPVASLIDHAGGTRINLYPRRRDTRYADLIFPVAPGRALTVDLYVFAGKVLQFAPADAAPEIADVLSPANPAMALHVTTAKPLSELYGGRVDLAVEMLVNPFLEPRAAPVTVSDAPDKRASVR